MAVRPVQRPDLKGGPAAPPRTQEPAPPPRHELTEVEKLIREAYMKGMEAERSKVFEETKRVPFIPPQRYEPAASSPIQQVPQQKPKITLSRILFNRVPLPDRRIRMARAVVFLLIGTILTSIGQLIAGSYYTATPMTGTLGGVMYGLEIGTILMIFGITFIWEGIKS